MMFISLEVLSNLLIHLVLNVKIQVQCLHLGVLLINYEEQLCIRRSFLPSEVFPNLFKLNFHNNIICVNLVGGKERNRVLMQTK